MTANVIDQIVESLDADPHDSLIALDYDGTLAPIVTYPRPARPVPRAGDVLAVLARRGVQVAIITGRDSCSVLELSGFDDVPDLIVLGSLGAQRWQHGHLNTPPAFGPIELARDVVAQVLANAPLGDQLMIENKDLSITVHARGAADPVLALKEITPMLIGVSRHLGLEVNRGRLIVELRQPGPDKASTLRGLVVESGRSQVLFAGDDVGDIAAFDLIVRLRGEGVTAWSVAVASDEVPELAAHADLTVADPAELVALLGQVANALP
jgi:trehalose 6-phosphate phosphatase